MKKKRTTKKSPKSTPDLSSQIRAVKPKPKDGNTSMLLGILSIFLFIGQGVLWAVFQHPVCILGSAVAFLFGLELLYVILLKDEASKAEPDTKISWKEQKFGSFVLSIIAIVITAGLSVGIGDMIRRGYGLTVLKILGILSLFAIIVAIIWVIATLFIRFNEWLAEQVIGRERLR